MVFHALLEAIASKIPAKGVGVIFAVVAATEWQASATTVDPVTFAGSVLTGDRERHRAGGEMSTGHDCDASSTSSSSNCTNVSCIASAAPPPSASRVSFEG